MAKSTTTTRTKSSSRNGKSVLSAPGNITKIAIRMYCIGTGDCFIVKFYDDEEQKFTMMIDCGSCRGDKEHFEPYIKNLQAWVNNEIDLLVITHEHNDHVNGFAKCENIFQEITIKQVWFAWTENPKDTEGRAQDLLKKRERMRLGFQKALQKMEENKKTIEKELTNDFYNKAALSAISSFLDGLDTLGEINLGAKENEGKPLEGMENIKKLISDKELPVKYLIPGTTRSFPQLTGIKFHVLGPPLDKTYIYKDGKEGKDIFKKNFSIGEGILAMNSFAELGKIPTEKDFPFGKEYIVDESSLNTGDIVHAPEHMQAYLTNTLHLVNDYKSDQWRMIENEWLYTAGSLAIRLNSHINNTSLVLAIECGEKGKVILFPGDAEFGSWESWHLIEKWKGEGKNGKHFVEDLLNRTVFYKVGHHMSYNGTALEKGINLMNHPELAAMATLDRKRIASRWKSTMPNKHLLKELIRRCQGKCFIMDESEIENAPSEELDPFTLGDGIYEEKRNDKGEILYKQYTISV